VGGRRGAGALRHHALWTRGGAGIRKIGVGIVVANVVFAVGAAAVLAAGVLPLPGAGVAMMLASITATLGLVYAQYLGVRRLA
jgi:hypothetical protein